MTTAEMEHTALAPLPPIPLAEAPESTHPAPRTAPRARRSHLGRSRLSFWLDWAPILLLGISVALAGVWRTAEAVRSISADAPRTSISAAPSVPNSR